MDDGPGLKTDQLPLLLSAPRPRHVPVRPEVLYGDNFFWGTMRLCSEAILFSKHEGAVLSCFLLSKKLNAALGSPPQVRETSTKKKSEGKERN